MINISYKMKILLFVTLLVFPLSSFADSTDVYCGSIDGEEWDWLYAEDGGYISLSGTWGLHRLNSMYRFKYFTIPENKYRKIQQQCALKSMMVHPADDRFTDWYVFKILHNDGTASFSKGFFNVYDYSLYL